MMELNTRGLVGSRRGRPGPNTAHVKVVNDECYAIISSKGSYRILFGKHRVELERQTLASYYNMCEERSGIVLQGDPLRFLGPIPF